MESKLLMVVCIVSSSVSIILEIVKLYMYCLIYAGNGACVFIFTLGSIDVVNTFLLSFTFFGYQWR